MTREAGFKRRVRARAATTGESYVTARARLDQRPRVLHVTNGDSAAAGLRQGGVEGAVLAWRDVLHEGPVPALTPAALARVRAAFLAGATGGAAAEIERGMRARDRTLAAGASSAIVLWFEADLYDQLQLVQVLDRLAAERRPPAITLVSIGEYPGRAHFGGLGELPAGELVGLRATAAVPVDAAALDLARRAWRAFTAPDPSGLPALAREHSPVLRHLAEAVERLLQEYPWTGDDLSLTERRVLRALGEGAQTPGEVFRRVQEAERRPFLGDVWCHRVLARVTREPRELDRWIGGVHLAGVPGWRWDPLGEALVPA
jgi:hypothetical protein